MQLQQGQQAARPNHNVEINADRLAKIVRSETAGNNTFDVLPKVPKDLLGVNARGLEDNFTTLGIHEQTKQTLLKNTHEVLDKIKKLNIQVSRA